MSRRRMVLWSVLLIALAGAIGYRISATRQQPAPSPVNIAFVTGGSSSFWKIAVAGAQAAAKRNNVELRVEMPAVDENLAQQTALLEKLGSAALDGIAISPLDAAGQTAQIDKLAKRTNVVTFDSDAQQSKRVSHIGTGNISAGQTCARLVSEAIPNAGKVAVLLANNTKENVLDRKAGFQERIATYTNEPPAGDTNPKPKYTVVDYLVDNGNDDACAENIRATLDKYPDLACFVGMNHHHGPVLVKTLTKLGKVDQIKLITFDVADETLDGIEAGHIYATLAQDPYQFGFESIQTLATLARGDETTIPFVGRGSLYISAEPIKKDNLDEFRKRMAKRQAAPAKAA